MTKLEEDEVKSKVSDKKYQAMKEDNFKLKETPKHQRNFKEYFKNKINTCKKLLSQPIVSKLSNKQKLGVLKSMKKVVNMKLRVSKIKKGSMEPLNAEEEFHYEEEDQQVTKEDYEDEEQQVTNDEYEEDQQVTEEEYENEEQVTNDEYEEDDEDKEIHKNVEKVKEEIRNKGPGSVDMMSVGPEFWSALRELKLRKCDISEGQNILEAAIRKQKHFISHAGRFEMLRLSEVSVPQQSTGDVYERFCSACDMNVPLKDWLSHVKTVSPNSI